MVGRGRCRRPLTRSSRLEASCRASVDSQRTSTDGLTHRWPVFGWYVLGPPRGSGTSDLAQPRAVSVASLAATDADVERSVAGPRAQLPYVVCHEVMGGGVVEA